jgi:hypothetical protein
MGIQLASILAAIILLVTLFLLARFLLGQIIRRKGKQLFIPIIIVSVVGFAFILYAIPFVWYLLSILLAGEGFGR